MIRAISTVFFLFTAIFIAPVSAEEKKLAAEEVISYLIGHWRFELGERTGGRIYTPLFDENSAEIEEYFDGLPVAGKGLVQYSAADDTFSSALFFNVGENDFISGVYNEENQTILYRSAKPEYSTLEIVFHIIGPDHFEFNNYQTRDNARTQVLHVDFYRVK